MLEERQGSSEEKIFKAHLLPKEEDGEKATPGEGQAAEAGVPVLRAQPQFGRVRE